MGKITVHKSPNTREFRREYGNGIFPEMTQIGPHTEAAVDYCQLHNITAKIDSYIYFAH